MNKDPCWVPHYLHRPPMVLWFEAPVWAYFIALFYVLMGCRDYFGWTLLLVYPVLAYQGSRELINLPRSGHWHVVWWTGLGGLRLLGRWAIPGGLQGYPPRTIHEFNE